MATIYLVDDDAAVRAGLEMMLEAGGWRVRSAASTAEFLRSYRGDDKACLVIDLQMPGGDGATLLESLARRRVALPAIVITGYPEGPLAQRARAAGALAVLAKPFREEELLHWIGRALGAARTDA